MIASLSWLLTGDPTALETWLAALISPAIPDIPAESRPMTIGDIEGKRQSDKVQLASDTATLSNITQTVANDNVALAKSTADTGSALKSSKRNGSGPYTRADGTVYVLITDTSADGFHEVDLAPPSTVIDEAPPVDTTAPPVDQTPIETTLAS